MLDRTNNDRNSSNMLVRMLIMLLACHSTAQVLELLSSFEVQCEDLLFHAQLRCYTQSPYISNPYITPIRNLYSMEPTNIDLGMGHGT